MTGTDSSKAGSIQTVEDLEEAYRAVEKLTRWMKDMKHKLDCTYYDLKLYLRHSDMDVGIVDEARNRIGECRVLAKCVIEELDK
jgi:hypothetical protein